MPRPPRGARGLPPVPEPPRSAIERRDLLQRFQPRGQLEGVYKLRTWQSPKGLNLKASGYLIITRRYLSMHLLLPGYETPQFQAGFRRYRLQGDKLLMSNLVGHRNDGGKILIEAENREQVRRFTVIGGTLRIHQGRNSYMDFVRIE